jgi:single-strand DNA-binding protein
MNSCVLMAQIQEAPKLRKTQDNQSLTEMLVQFEGLRDDEPPATLRVVAWGNLAEDVHQNYFAGDRVIIVGRLKMMMIEREEGMQRFKEKRAELIASSFEKIGIESSEGFSAPSASASRASNVISMDSYNKPPTPEIPTPTPGSSRSKPSEPSTVPSKVAPPPNEADLDDIPF